ncbi:hypothetical protein PC119_g24586 [Phytophthora cactorum]|nr:hypothetical protein PC119_g24586 [Phytophthora cactorum]KAG2979832.1 hypothetical protein PC120_g25078 [Phytophthora cactorum]KAG3127105.1 hypothetical protein C6341_g25107 [Phytophthora cactorum]
MMRGVVEDTTLDFAGVGGDGGVGGGTPGGRCQYEPKLNEGQAAQAEASIFVSIRANEVQQQASRTYDSAGEVLPSGVALILAAVGPLREDGIALDVGAGVGNILAQVALTTDVRDCVGVELRSDLISLGQYCMQQQIKHYSRLGKMLLKTVDVRDVSMSTQPPICEVTIVFANITVLKKTQN